MNKWEYQYRQVPVLVKDKLKLFNELGEEGWEPIISNVFDGDGYGSIFKRPKRVPIEEQLEKMVEKYSEVPPRQD